MILNSKDAPRWNPQQTRACVICLAKFEGEREPSFSMDDRTDNGFVEMLKQRGVPPAQILFLQDEDATKTNIEKRFVEFLRAGRPGEMLLLYLGSHGSYDANTQEFWFSSYDDYVPFVWVLDTIDQNFRGDNALLLTDTCYSGGMVDLLAKRTSRIGYAGLSSTYAHNLGWSGWRFVTAVQRGFEGSALADLDEDGRVGLRELAHYVEAYMGFVAEGKPMFAASNGFPRNLILSDVKTPLKDLQIGQCVEAFSVKDWYLAEIIEVQGKKLKVHFTDYGDEDDEWVTPDKVRGYAYPRFWNGAHVQVQDADDEKWYPARVLDGKDSMFLCEFEEYGREYDEWVGPSRIK